MSKDYRFLIGHRFALGGEIYVVQDLGAGNDHTLVKANPSAEDGTATASCETFSVADVIQALVVDEEIELFNPNFLAAR